MLRRTLGDEKLTYLGFSYGSILGSYYANMFPDRVRALVIDGVVDPTRHPATASVPLGVRMRAGEGSARAMQELLERCEKAGPEVCPFAEPGDATQEYRRLLDTVKADPILTPFPRTYAYEVGMLSFGLGQHDPWNPVLAELSDLRDQLDGRDDATGASGTTPEAPDPGRGLAGRRGTVGAGDGRGGRVLRDRREPALGTVLDRVQRQSPPAHRALPRALGSPC